MPLQSSKNRSSPLTFKEMCHTTQATTHSYGHARTSALITRCAESLAAGRRYLLPSLPPQVVPDSQCWSCFQAQIGQSEFCEFLVDNLVVPETTVIEGKVEGDWIDAHRRERERRLRRKASVSKVGVSAD